MTAPLQAPDCIAFIGLGNIGGPMASCVLAKGWRLRVFDANQATLKDFVVRHDRATRCASAADAALGASAVITMLPDGKAVRQALLGPEGAAAVLRSGDIVIDMTSSSPADTRDLGAALAARGIELIDAPVSGGVRSARIARLTVMVGGDAAQLARVHELLGAMAGAIHHVGALGCGHAMKALNNYVSAAGLIATCEALVIGRACGLDPAAMVDVMNASTGRNSATADKARQYMLSGTFQSGGALAMLAKDVRFALDMSRRAGLSAELIEDVADLLTRAESRLGPQADHTEIFRLVDIPHG